MNFCILLIICSLKYISIEKLCYTVLFFSSLKILDLVNKISAKYSFSNFFCENQRLQGILKVFRLSRLALKISRSSFGLKFRRFEYYRLGCGSLIRHYCIVISWRMKQLIHPSYLLTRSCKFLFLFHLIYLEI